MYKYKIVGLCDLHNAPQLGDLTKFRCPASTSFLARYALIDVALSNFVNSNIDIVGIMVKDNVKSIFGHLGSKTAWISNTKIGKETIMINEKFFNDGVRNTDVQNLIANPWIKYSNADYIIIQPSHIIMNCDFRWLFKKHIKSKADVTMLYVHNTDAKNTFINDDIITIDGDSVVNIEKNDRKHSIANNSLETFIISKEVYSKIVDIEDAEDNYDSILDYIRNLTNSKAIKTQAVEFKKYVRCIDSMEHYMKYSLEVRELDIALQIFDKKWPYYTLTHDTPPATYGNTSEVRDSFVANGAHIYGKVDGSFISRNVFIDEGATVKDSIILSGCRILKGAYIEGAIIDKHNEMDGKTCIKGSIEKPIYIKKRD